jgi:hypothetical protein
VSTAALGERLKVNTKNSFKKPEKIEKSRTLEMSKKLEKKIE